jgi:hypothetical protein
MLIPDPKTPHRSAPARTGRTKKRLSRWPQGCRLTSVGAVTIPLTIIRPAFPT